MTRQVEAALAEPISVREPAWQLTPEELLARWHVLRLEHALRVPLSAKAPLTVDTELVIDGCSYIDSRPVPLSVLHRQRVLPADLGVHALATALVGRQVGDEVQVVAPLPPTFALARVREAPVHQVLWVREAHTLELPAEDSPEFLSRLGLGADVKETLKVLAQSAAQEHWLQTSVLLGEDIALVLAARLGLEVEESVLEAQLMTLWAQTDGRALQALGQSAEQLEASRLSWRAEPELRELARRQQLIREVICRLAEARLLSAAKVSEAIDNAVDAYRPLASAQNELIAPLLLRLGNSAAWIEAMRQLTQLSCIRFLS